MSSQAIYYERKWEYNEDWSYEANLHSWTDACNFERKQYGERILTDSEATMKFAEIYGSKFEHEQD